MQISPRKFELLLLEAATTGKHGRDIDLANAMGISPRAVTNYRHKMTRGEGFAPHLAGKIIVGFGKLLGREVALEELKLREEAASTTEKST